MPVLAHRRLCSMLNELSPILGSEKTRALDVCLRHQETKTALAAEAELIVLWGISQVAEFDAEPVLPGSTRRPEAFSENMFTSGPAIIEVRALSDESFSGREAMDRTANIIAGYVDQLKKKSGDHLYFEFQERSYRESGRFHRERCVDPKFQLTDEIRQQLKTWVFSADWESSQIRISSGKTDAVVSWRSSNHRLFRTFCRMPAVAYDVEDNPVFKALKGKSKQLKGADPKAIRCVVLVDMGCGILRNLDPMSSLNEVGGADIIRHALRRLSLDTVFVLSPFRQGHLSSHQTTMVWNLTCFDSRDVGEGEYEHWERMADALPRPHVEGYQARSMHVQGMFQPDSSLRYLTSKITSRREGKMTIKLSAGLLHDYLSGITNAERFQDSAFGTKGNLFASERMRGNSIRSARFEPGGIDEDDDYVIFDLDADPATSTGLTTDQLKNEES